MDIVSPVSSIWRKQKFLLAGFLLAIGGWFFYDGLIGYPKKNEAFRAHESLKKEQRISEWPKLARERGWALEAPHRFFEPNDIQVQLAIGTVACLLGVATGLWVLKVQKTTLRSDDQQFWDQAGRAIPFTAVTTINRKRWETKGLADVFYEHGGRKGKVRFDDYKYTGCEKIFAQIEENLAGRTGDLETTKPGGEKRVE